MKETETTARWLAPRAAPLRVAPGDFFAGNREVFAADMR